MLDRVADTHGIRPRTLVADAGYDASDFLLDLEARGIEPNIALRRAPAGEPRRQHPLSDRQQARERARQRQSTARYQQLQRQRRATEQGFAWIKHHAGLNRARQRKRTSTSLLTTMFGAAYNLVRGCQLTNLAPVQLRA